MLTIFNNLGVFLEDCYKEVNVREYARLLQISPPTASKVLKQLTREGLLKTRAERKNQLYWANRESLLFIELSKAYWQQKLAPLTLMLSEKTNYESIVLFGSLIKGEVTISSDIDLYIHSSEKEIRLDEHEKNMKRKIQLHFRKELNNPELKKSIQQGTVLYGAMI